MGLAEKLKPVKMLCKFIVLEGNSKVFSLKVGGYIRLGMLIWKKNTCVDSFRKLEIDTSKNSWVATPCDDMLIGC